MKLSDKAKKAPKKGFQLPGKKGKSAPPFAKKTA